MLGPCAYGNILWVTGIAIQYTVSNRDRNYTPAGTNRRRSHTTQKSNDETLVDALSILSPLSLPATSNFTNGRKKIVKAIKITVMV